MRKVLVVFYSRSGTTALVARQVAEAMGADLDVIEDATERRGVLGFVRSALEAALHGLPAVRSQRDPRSYDLVVVGTPVWFGSMASPVRAYLFQQRERLPQLAFFTTCRARGALETQRELRLMAGDSAATSCNFLERDVANGTHQAELTRFVFALRRCRDEARAA